MKTLIVNKSDLSIAGKYDGSPKQDQYGGPWANPDLFVHLEMPEGMSDLFISVSEDSPGEYTVNEDTEARAEWDLGQLRAMRDQKLKESDWTQLPDVALGSSEVANWATYRQALRDITDTYQSLDTVVWPAEPVPEV